MGFKSRWLSVALFAVGLILIAYSRWSCHPCPDCNQLTEPTKTIAEVNIDNLLRTTSAVSRKSLRLDDNSAVIRESGDRSEHEVLGVHETVVDCISWEDRWKYSQDNLTLRDFSTSIGHSGSDGEGAVKRKQTFQTIFNRRDWPGANDSTYWGLKASGPGATMRNAQGVVAALHSLITRLKAYLGKKTISILDVPCGDLQWMSRFLDTRWDLEYTGMDIVPELIEHHRRTYKRMKNAVFIESDVVSVPLNRSYDLILCRDMLQHLWRADALSALRTFSQSGSRFLLVTTFLDTTRNDEVERKELGGRKSAYNLELAPFSLPPPTCLSYDWNIEHLGLWELPLKQKVAPG